MKVAYITICVLLASVIMAAPLPAYCGPDEAVPIVPLNNPDMAIINAQTIIRHGDRTPSSNCWPGSGPWTCDLNIQSRQDFSSEPVTRLYPKIYTAGRNIQPGTCAAGQLTEKGNKQHLAKGRMFRKYFIDTLGLLPQDLTPSTFYVHSDDVPRVVASAQALMLGMYPPQTYLNGKIELIDINTEDLANQFMYGNYLTCPRLRPEEKKFQQTQAFIDHYNQVTVPIAQEFAQIFNVNASTLLLGDLFDCLAAHMCHGMPWPQGITMDLFNRLTDDVLWNYIAPYNYSNVVTLDIGFLLEQIYINLQRIVSGTGSVKPFILYAGHDSTLSPLLAALGVADGSWPGYASHFIIETYQQQSTGSYYHRMIYNNKIVSLPGCTSLCPSDFVLNAIRQKSITDPSVCAASTASTHAWLSREDQTPSFIETLRASTR